MIEDFQGGPGFLAFVATFALVAAVVLLIRSLNKHLRKVRADQGPVAAASPASGETSTAGSVEDGQRGGDVVADERGDS